MSKKPELEPRISVALQKKQHRRAVKQEADRRYLSMSQVIAQIVGEWYEAKFAKQEQ